MAAFDVSVGGKSYKMFYDRASVRQFEEIGGNISDMKEKLFSTADRLFYVGLRKFHKGISFMESQQISDAAIEEYGIDTVFGGLLDKFMEVFTQGADNATAMKSFITSKASKA